MLEGDDFGDERAWSEGSIIVRKVTLREVCYEWHRGQKFQGAPETPADFGKKVKESCRSTKTSQPKGSAGKRIECYRLPSPTACPEEFERAMNIPPGVVVW